MEPRGRVLLVDDDDLVLKILRTRLEGAGFVVMIRRARAKTGSR
jgi:DNA-binding response OmpR family regulator